MRVLPGAASPRLYRQVYCPAFATLGPAEPCWAVATFTPGGDPFFNLAKAAFGLLEPSTPRITRLERIKTLAGRLSSSDEKTRFSLDEVLEEARSPEGRYHILLVINQI